VEAVSRGLYNRGHNPQKAGVGEAAIVRPQSFKRKGYAMKVKITKGPIRHDKAVCKVGDILEMDEVAGKRLVDLGVAEPTEGDVTAPTTQPPTVTATGTTGENSDTSLDVDKMTRDELAQELSVRGVLFKKTADREVLAAALKEAMAKQ